MLTPFGTCVKAPKCKMITADGTCVIEWDGREHGPQRDDSCWWASPIDKSIDTQYI